ncbi:uncharacterized protein PAC_17446 [Phialocephala subalpina]|uniref:Uncharacterized protein n=1 Tax=Phialocephala subalpina TaxID=576137 RepID=A0A1L7XRJ3_9HELO|nr:uncharacterized protein PAC_17446 [Phialocephala subalpina]
MAAHTRSQTANIENQKPTRREGNIVQLSGRIQSVKATEDWCREEAQSKSDYNRDGTKSIDVLRHMANLSSIQDAYLLASSDGDSSSEPSAPKAINLTFCDFLDSLPRTLLTVYVCRPTSNVPISRECCTVLVRCVRSQSVLDSDLTRVIGVGHLNFEDLFEVISGSRSGQSLEGLRMDSYYYTIAIVPAPGMHRLPAVRYLETIAPHLLKCHDPDSEYEIPEIEVGARELVPPNIEVLKVELSHVDFSFVIDFLTEQAKCLPPRGSTREHAS